MALPLLWLGAAVAGAWAANEISKENKKRDLRRWQSDLPLTHLGDKGDKSVEKYPSVWLQEDVFVAPVPGALVCCGIAGVLDHTGIWVGDDTIVELDGNGLIKGLSSARFTQHRSGSHIFIACDSTGQPLANVQTADSAIGKLYQYRDYDLIRNNCHRFVWECISGNDEQLTTFAELNNKLARLYQKKVFWDRCQVSEGSRHCPD